MEPPKQFTPLGRRPTQIVSRTKTHFKINYAFSFLLQHKETGEQIFFHASHNNSTRLETNRLIKSKKDFVTFIDEINSRDHLADVQTERPNSEFFVERIMATSFYVYPIRSYNIGKPPSALPEYIQKIPNTVLSKFMKPAKNAANYDDNLCFFRALALFLKLTPIEKEAKKLLSSYYPNSEFWGVTIADLDNLEQFFSINIDVYSFEKKNVLLPVRRSEKYTYPTTMSLLLVEEHFMLIHNLNQLSRTFACSVCGKLFKKAYFMKKHVQVCPVSKEVCPGGVYRRNMSIFEKLERYGIETDLPLNYVYPFRAVYDFESFFKKHR